MIARPKVVEARPALLELERVRAQLQRVDRLAAFGVLAGGVGHELNNLATLVQGVMVEVGDALAEGRPPVADVEEDLQAIFDHLVLHGRQLMHVARDHSEKLERLDLRRVVGATLDMLHGAGRTKYVKLDRDFAEASLDHAIVRTRIEQVVVNLVSNAVDAVLREGAHTKDIKVRVWSPELGLTSIQVEDDGPGVPEELREAIFAPYFTTKDPGRGTGLGLAVARQIVESLDGTLTLERTPRPAEPQDLSAEPTAAAVGGERGAVRELRGARFRVTLPQRSKTLGDSPLGLR